MLVKMRLHYSIKFAIGKFISSENLWENFTETKSLIDT